MRQDVQRSIASRSYSRSDRSLAIQHVSGLGVACLEPGSIVSIDQVRAIGLRPSGLLGPWRVACSAWRACGLARGPAGRAQPAWHASAAQPRPARTAQLRASERPAGARPSCAQSASPALASSFFFFFLPFSFSSLSRWATKLVH
jgi:hypothetical protein